MQVRSLSPTSFWMEKPLSPQTLRLIWRAMVECGLHSGKISSSSSGYLALPPAQLPHIVEGRTHTGFLALNALVQAQLESDGSGTRVQIEAMNARGDFDFGAASRFKVRFARYLADFLRVVSADRDEPEPVPTSVPPLSELPAPIASPTHASAFSSLSSYGPPGEIEYGHIAPLDTSAPSSQLQSVLYILGLIILSRSGLTWAAVLFAFAWKVWQWRHGQKPTRIDVIVLSVAGLMATVQLARTGFRLFGP